MLFGRWLFSRKRIAWAVLFFLLLGYALLLRKDLFREPLSTVILDRQGHLLGAKTASDGQWRFPPAEQIPEKIKQATLVFEDRYFYRHPGFNPVALGRAAILNIRAHAIVSGGSTITMQTIRLSRKGKPRTVPEKFIEIVLATRLEFAKRKEEILGMYLANAPYGGNVVGIDAAAWRYFGTSAYNLSWAEATMLAVLPNSPTLVHPGKNRNSLLAKRNRLLRKLEKLGKIDNTTLQTALQEPIPERPLPLPMLAPHLLSRFNREYPDRVSKTTIDRELQVRAAEVVENHLKKFRYNKVYNAAAIIIEVESGNVLAYVGNTAEDTSGLHGGDVDIIVSPRSTGSLLKPVLYAAMLDDGKILPNSLVADVPINLSGFAPKNFDGGFEGAVPASRALSRSLNVPAVQMLKDYGIDRFHHLLGNLGMKTVNRQADHYGLSLILGGAEGRLEEMTNLYACFSRVLNHYAADYLYYQTDYRPANLVPVSANKTAGVKEPGWISAAALWFTYNAMNEVNRPEEEQGWRYFGSSQKIAWKTGTSFGYRDGWAIGTSPRFVVGVWVGNADGEGRPGLTGIAAAAPLLFELFGLLPSAGWFGAPTDEIAEVRVCHQSGFLASPSCEVADTVGVQLSGIHAAACPFHRIVHLTTDRKFRVNSNCAEPGQMVHPSWFILPPVQEYYYKKRHSDYRSLPPFKEGCMPENQRSIDLVYPKEGAILFIPLALSGKKSKVVFEAIHSNSWGLIYWHLDGQFLTVTRDIHQVELQPSKGRHTLVMIDENGEELVRHFEVIEKEE